MRVSQWLYSEYLKLCRHVRKPTLESLYVFLIKRSCWRHHLLVCLSGLQRRRNFLSLCESSLSSVRPIPPPWGAQKIMITVAVYLMLFKLLRCLPQSICLCNTCNRPLRLDEALLRTQSLPEDLYFNSLFTVDVLPNRSITLPVNLFFPVTVKSE